MAKDSAWESEENPTCPVAPPRLRVTSLPLDWQVLMSLAMADWQFARSVPENVGSSHWLQVYVSVSERDHTGECNACYTYVCEVDNRFSACSSEDVKEGKRNDVNRIILAVKRQTLLRISTVLSPVTIDASEYNMHMYEILPYTAS